jgi:hypothetical protein
MAAFTGLPLIALVLLSQACASPAANPPPSSSREPVKADEGDRALHEAIFGKTCAPRAPEASPRITPETHVFVELAEVQPSAEVLDRAARAPSNSNLARMLDHLRKSVVWSAHLLATDGKAASISWSDAPPEQACQHGCRTVTVTPHLDVANPDTVRLDLSVAVRPEAQRAEGGALEPNSTSVTVQDQQLVMLGFAKGRSMLSVIPYVLSSDEELQRLFACKSSNRAEALRQESRPSSP